MARTVMSLILLSALPLTACNREGQHPAQLVGTWVAERDLGSGDRSVDSLSLRADGHAELRRLGYHADTLRSNTHESAEWHIDSSEDRLSLCLVSPEHRELSICGPLRVVAADRMQWGAEYRRAGT